MHNPITTWSTRLTLALAATCALPPQAHAEGLGGEALAFQLFSLGDMSITNSAPDGGVATAGNFDATGCAIGSNLTPGVDSMIVAGGDVTLRNGTYQNGLVSIGGARSIDQSANLIHAHVIQQPPALDFDNARQTYTDISTELAVAPTTGTVHITSYNAITLKGLQDGLNVYHLNEQEYENSNGIAVPDFDPDVHTLVINVAGQHVVRGSNGSLFVGAINGPQTYERLSSNGDLTRHRRLLWNFFEAETLVSNGSIHGAVLAPDATLTHQNGRLVGQVIAGNIDLRNAARLRGAQFNGELEAPEVQEIAYD